MATGIDYNHSFTRCVGRSTLTALSVSKTSTITRMMQVLTGQLTFKSLTPPDLSCCTKEQLIAYFENSYDLNESLFTALKDESVMYKCPDRLRLPLIFYYAHTAVVYVNKLILAGLMKGRVDQDFEKIFETGVDEMSWDDTENYRMGGSYEWPKVSEVVAYRKKVREMIIEIIKETPLQLPITMESPWWAVLMGMEHERIHLETSSVLIRQLPVDSVRKPDQWIYGPSQTSDIPKENKMIALSGTDVCFGKPKEFPSYGWDNEYGEINCFVPSFEASEYPISNLEFYQFMKAGGYENQDYWTEEGWKWRMYREAKHPMFWVCNNGCKSGCGADLASYSHCRFSDKPTSNGVNREYRYRAMFDVIDMPWAWPVDVNYHEAKAFCAWKGQDFRLLIEAEHNVIRGKQAPASTGTSCDIIYNKERKYNHNMEFGSSTPVNMNAPNELGFYDVYGNVWEWVEDHFNGLCTDTHWLYDDFSSPCYDGKHNVILGGSWISTGDEASRFARYAFRRHFLQHAGFRVARNVLDKNEKVQLPVRLVNTEVYVLGCGVEEKSNYLDSNKIDPVYVPSTNLQYEYDSEPALKGILEMEFGFRKSFPVVVADFCMDLVRNNFLGTQSALWLGSGSGRGPLILSKHFDEILASDYAARYLDVAMQLQAGETIPVQLSSGQQVHVTCEPASRPDKVIFKQFTWIPNEVGWDYDLTIVTFLERTLHPKAWLLRLAEITKRKGLVVIASSSGTFNRQELEPTLSAKNLVCAEDRDVPYESTNGTEMAALTVWRHA